MAISYPVSVPDHNFASMSMRLRRANAMTESTFTLQQQVYQYTGAVWEAEIRLPPMKREDAKRWEAFILSLRGMQGTFLMGNPLHSTTTATNVQLEGAASIRETEVLLSGTGSLEAGDVFSIGSGNDTHIHMIIEDVDLGGTANIEPPLRASYADNATLDFTLPKGVWRLAANDIGWDIDQASIHGFTIPCIEAL